jgi:hypothetical protein
MTFVSQMRISLSSKTDCADAIKVFADFLRSFHRLVSDGRLDAETEFLACPNPAELRRRLRGISSSFLT